MFTEEMGYEAINAGFAEFFTQPAPPFEQEQIDAMTFDEPGLGLTHPGDRLPPAGADIRGHHVFFRRPLFTSPISFMEGVVCGQDDGRYYVEWDITDRGNITVLQNPRFWHTADQLLWDPPHRSSFWE